MKTVRNAILSCLIALLLAVRAVALNTTPLGAVSWQLHGPARVAADAAGNLYVTDPAAGRVVVFDAFGQPSAVHEGFAGPLAIAIASDGRIYLSEEQTGCVSVFDAQWNRLYQLGGGTNEFQLPGNLAVDPRAPDTVYVSDGPANLVRVFTGAVQTSQFGGVGTGDGQFDFPAGAGVRTNGEVFVVDQKHDRVQVFTNGAFAWKFALGSGGVFGGPSGRSQALLVDNAGRVFVTETMQGVVNVFDANSGAALGSIGGFGEGAGQLNMPIGIVLDRFNRLCVVSANNARVELFGVDDFLHLTAQAGNGNLVAGNNLVFRAISGGTNAPTYQWQKNGALVDGGTNSTLTVSNAAITDSGSYAVVISGASGWITSAVTSVSVVAAPKILADPQSQTAMRGDDVNLSVAASGTALSYQWQFNGVNLDGATTASLPLNGVQETQAGQYVVLITNSVGKAISAVASLGVITPPSIMEMISGMQPTNQPFQLTMNVDPGYNYSLEATTDFATWLPIASITDANGLFDFVDEDSTNYVNRFYRLHWAR